jgi:hypothetical protein
VTPLPPLGLVTPVEYLFLPPILFAIALVTSAAHREDTGTILRHAMRSWLVMLAGIVLFVVAVSYFFELVLP